MGVLREHVCFMLSAVDSVRSAVAGAVLLVPATVEGPPDRRAEADPVSDQMQAMP